MKSMIVSLIWATLITIVGAALSESNLGTLSTIKNYIIADLNKTTEGVIVKSEGKILGKYGVSAYDIRYTYNVDNEFYFGNQVNYDVRSSNPEDYLEKYTVDMLVQVYYDSSNPQYSILEKSTLGFGVYFQIFLLIITFILTVVFYLYIAKLA
jgi:hypothetical protein